MMHPLCLRILLPLFVILGNLNERNRYVRKEQNTVDLRYIQNLKMPFQDFEYNVLVCLLYTSDAADE